MTRRAARRIVLACAACAGLGAAPVSAVDIAQDLDVYVQQRFMGSGPNPRQSKYEEYHPVPNGVVLDRYKLDLYYEDYDLSFAAKNVDQLDQSYRVEGGRPGVFTYKAVWDQTPHIFSYSARSLYFGSGGVLTMDPVLRNANQTTPANFIGNMQSALLDSPFVPLQIQSEKASVDLAYHPAKDLTVAVGGSRTHRFGARALGTGFSFSNNVEVAQPVNQVTDAAYLDVGLARKTYQADFRYELSDFQNQFENLTWDNPGRLTDANGSPSRGQLSAEPSNVAHSFTLSGGADLPAKTHFSAQAGASLWRQDETLNPLTINPTVTGSPFVNPADPANLPMSRADRKINVYTQSYRLANSYFGDFRTSLAYRSYIMENRSADFTLPGYVRADSNWVNGTVTAQPYENRKDDIDWKGDYDLTKTVSLTGGYTYEYKKESREIPKSGENIVSAGTTWKPVSNFFVNLSGLVGLRRMKAYDPQTIEAAPGVFTEMPGLVRFDVGDRNRAQGRAQMQVNHGDSTYGLSYRITQDHYRPGDVPLNGGIATNLFQQYGMLVNDTQAAGVDLSQELPRDFTLDTYFEFDYSRRLVRSNVNSGGVINQDAAHDWEMRTTETSNIGGI
jgi:hypothetical protein